MKLPSLFRSLFDNEPVDDESADNGPALGEAVPPAPQPPALTVDVANVTRNHDPLLDGIDTLGEIVLALHTQLQAERTSSTQLRDGLRWELKALTRGLADRS